MIRSTLVTGILLIILGVGSYLITGMTSVTALIPSFFGIILTAFGILGKPEQRRKLFMHSAMGLALLGFLGSVSGIGNVITMLGGGDVPRPGASVAQAIMAIIVLVYLVLGIKSFIDARRK